MKYSLCAIMFVWISYLLWKFLSHSTMPRLPLLKHSWPLHWLPNQFPSLQLHGFLNPSFMELPQWAGSNSICLKPFKLLLFVMQKNCKHSPQSFHRSLLPTCAALSSPIFLSSASLSSDSINLLVVPHIHGLLRVSLYMQSPGSGIIANSHPSYI